jgi:nicotinate-nucleotide adenylyltransferase
MTGGVRVVLPPAAPGQSVGLFGGSFNPPHAGHAHVAETALVRLGLDRIWWLVTPGNPLKDTAGLPSIEERMAAVRRLAAHPRASVTDVEARLHTRYTLDTIEALTRLRPDLRFVLVIGADNWASFHRWQGWRRIAGLVRIAVVDRPGATYAALASPAARAFAGRRLRDADARSLVRTAPPAWVFLAGRRVPLSSTALRARGGRDLSP